MVIDDHDPDGRLTHSGTLGHLARTRHPQQYLGAGPALGWEEHLGGPIRVHEVSGSHFTMMSEPGVSELIAGLRHELGLGNLPPRKPPAPWWASLVRSRARGAA